VVITSLSGRLPLTGEFSKSNFNMCLKNKFDNFVFHLSETQRFLAECCVILGKMRSAVLCDAIREHVALYEAVQE
jgi:hypothetical protein